MQNQAKIKSLIESGQELSKQGRLAEAIEIFTEVVSLIESEENPDAKLLSWAYIRLGALQGREGNKDEALACAESAVDIAGVPQEPSQVIVLMQILTKGVGMTADEAAQWLEERGNISDDNLLMTEQFAKKELNWKIDKTEEKSSFSIPHLQLNLILEPPQPSYHGPTTEYNIIKQHYNNNEFMSVLTNNVVKSRLVGFGKELPSINIYPTTIIVLYYAGLSHLKLGNVEMGLRCLQLLYSIQLYEPRIDYMPFSHLIKEGSEDFIELCKDIGYRKLVSSNMESIKDAFSSTDASSSFPVRTIVVFAIIIFIMLYFINC